MSASAAVLPIYDYHCFYGEPSITTASPPRFFKVSILVFKAEYRAPLLIDFTTVLWWSLRGDTGVTPLFVYWRGATRGTLEVDLVE